MELKSSIGERTSLMTESYRGRGGRKEESDEYNRPGRTHHQEANCPSLVRRSFSFSRLEVYTNVKKREKTQSDSISRSARSDLRASLGLD